MRTRTVFVVGILLVVLPAGPTPAEEPAFEVLVVGTIHAPWQFRGRAFHPGHVRAALEIATPDVIGVESNPAWFAEGTFHDVTYEAQGIAVPWGKARAIPVYGVDWMDVAAWEKRTQAQDRQRADHLERMRAQGGLGGWAFGQVANGYLEKTKAFFESEDFDFRLVNDIASDTYGQNWVQGARTLKPFGGHRNNEIVKRCIEVMKTHPGKRLVVVIGAGHKAVLDELFRREPKARLLEWERDVPAPTEEQARAALTNEDLLVILGHNLDGERSYFHRELIDMERMKEILDDLGGRGGDPRLTAYFRARWYGHTGDIVAARVLLERLHDGAFAGPLTEARPYPFPLEHWRMAYDLPQAVRLERARLLLGGDRRAEGETILRALAAERPEPEGPRDAGWRQQLLAKTFPLHLIGETSAQPAAGGARPVATGWDAADPGHGRLRIERDPESGALRVDLEHAEGPGSPYFSRRFELGRRGGTWTFSARVRSKGVERITLEAYVWPDGRRAETIASKAIVPSGDAWQAVELTLPVPADQGALLVNVYAARTAQGSLWLDDAQLKPKPGK